MMNSTNATHAGPMEGANLVFSSQRPAASNLFYLTMMLSILDVMKRGNAAACSPPPNSQQPCLQYWS